MSMQEIMDDSTVKFTERMILRGCITDTEFKFVIEQRGYRLQDLFEYNEENKVLLKTFNECLKQAQIKLFRQGLKVYGEALGQAKNLGINEDDVEVECKIALPTKYPEIHPLQTETAKKVWEVLTTGGYIEIYDNNIGLDLWFDKHSKRLLKLSEKELQPYINKYLYMNDKEDNWNDGMNRKWSKNLNLLYGVHNLTDHCCFSFYDLLYVREFDSRIQVTYSKKL